ncbi:MULTISPECIES: DsbA family protein [Acidithrix]|uniref:DSBA-like thioredoxin domain protein n=2 Tax=root TaxID=1 RepID=A0A0D8HM74_9ACTN|nr:MULTISPECIES: DsbA family protein [Acidithrix]KJF18847.1 DSBA-like thioredoxin domain protein [Acidithrix ferrooxidans]
MSQPKINQINFFFDPICPWTFVASQWIRNVANTKGIPLVFRPFSLQIKNSDKTPTEPFISYFRASQPTLRMAANLRKTDPEHNLPISELYWEFAKEFHLNNNKFEINPVEIALKIGLDEATIKAKDDESLDSFLKKEMDYALSFTGNDVGVPIIVLENETSQRGFFGPILGRVPNEQEGIDLWNSLIHVAEMDFFYEAKRIRGSVVVS